jgi:hypothetical protein
MRRHPTMPRLRIPQLLLEGVVIPALRAAEVSRLLMARRPALPAAVLLTVRPRARRMVPPRALRVVPTWGTRLRRIRAAGALARPPRILVVALIRPRRVRGAAFIRRPADPVVACIRTARRVGSGRAVALAVRAAEGMAQRPREPSPVTRHRLAVMRCTQRTVA